MMAVNKQLRYGRRQPKGCASLALRFETWIDRWKIWRVSLVQRVSLDRLWLVKMRFMWYLLPQICFTYIFGQFLQKKEIGNISDRMANVIDKVCLLISIIISLIQPPFH